MTASKVLEIYNTENENDIPEEIKKIWISELDKKIVGELFLGREGERVAYTPEEPLSYSLNAPVEYEEIYLFYLKMKTAYYFGEIERYNNSAMIFNRAYYELSSFISRNFKLKNNTELRVELNND